MSDLEENGGLDAAQRLRVYAATCPEGGVVRWFMSRDEARRMAMFLEQAPKLAEIEARQRALLARIARVRLALVASIFAWAVAAALGFAVLIWGP